MPKRQEADVTPALLIWARVSAGLEPAEAASRAMVDEEQIASWEAGTTRPSIPQLRKLAHAYKRPLAVFYLPEAPKTFKPMHDYRRVPGVISRRDSPDLLYQIRLAHARRLVALDLSSDLGVQIPEIAETLETSENAESAGKRIRMWLDVSLQDQVSWRTSYDALNAWRQAVESKGVLVFQILRVSSEEARGFSITQMPLPVIGINIKEPPHARAFTILHELAHILLRKEGICDISDVGRRPPEEQALEVFCNRVAGSVILPKEALLDQLAIRSSEKPEEIDLEYVASLAMKYKISREVVLRRLLILGRISQGFYRSARERLLRESEQSKAKGPSGFVPPHQLAISSLGRSFIGLVLRGYSEARITGGDVAEYLSLKLKHLPRVVDALARHSSSEEIAP